jgi:hypothetical protein
MKIVGSLLACLLLTACRETPLLFEKGQTVWILKDRIPEKHKFYHCQNFGTVIFFYRSDAYPFDNGVYYGIQFRCPVDLDTWVIPQNNLSACPQEATTVEKPKQECKKGEEK